MRALIAALLIVSFLVITNPSAHADGDTPTCPAGKTPQTIPGGWICVSVVDPASEGDDGNPTPTGDNGSSNQAKCMKDGHELPTCTNELGTWFNSKQCYAQQMVPPPPASSPEWDGHSPDEGSIWSCTVNPHTIVPPFFVATGAAPALPDPEQMAQRALGMMKLAEADARIAPGPAFHTYVHIKNWLWVPADQWNALTMTVTAGQTSVTVTATPVRVNWDMGSETFSCADAGRASRKGMTDAAKTTCSYAYESLEHPTGDSHDVSAQIVYSAAWECNGACLTAEGDLGEISPPPGDTTTIQVRQRQTVVTN